MYVFELAEHTLPIVSECLFDMYQDTIQILKAYMIAISDFDSDMLTIQNTNDHTHIKQLRPQFNLAASHLLESQAEAFF